MDPLVKLELWVLRALQEIKGLQVALGQPGLRGKLDRLDLVEMLDRPAMLVSLVLLDNKEHQDLKELLEAQDLLDQWVKWDHLVPQDL